MLSPVFWLSLVAVFWGMKWLADGLLSLARVEVQRHAAGTLVEPGSLIGRSRCGGAAAAELDKAA